MRQNAAGSLHTIANFPVAHRHDDGDLSGAMH
jgi:hypothetical protein